MTLLNPPCIIWGATGQAKVVYDILSAEGTDVIHLFENDTSVMSPLASVPISYGTFGFLSFVKSLMLMPLDPSDIDCVAAIGGGNGVARKSITELMQSYGFNARSIIHSSSTISPLAHLGRGIQILAASIIGPYAQVGDYSIINSGANVDHDCSIGTSCHLAPRVALAGEVIVEDNVFIGINATILPRLRIGYGSVVGAGAVVTKDVPPETVVVGNPARPLIG